MKLYKKEWESLGWRTNSSRSYIKIVDTTQDSRRVKKGWAFFAYDGQKHKGKDFIPEVLLNKPAAIFVHSRYEKELRRFSQKHDTPFFFSSDFADDSTRTISTLFQDASDQIKLIGITGTNGKTTIALLLKNISEKLGKKALYLGTLGASISGEGIFRSSKDMTTPHFIDIYQILAKAIKKKACLGFLEVSSHALHQGRVQGLNFIVGVFTNLSQDHLDYHKNMQNYYESKKKLFEKILTQKMDQTPCFVVCVDDPYGKKLFTWLDEHPVKKKIITVSSQERSTLKITEIYPSLNGYGCRFTFQGKPYELKSCFLGTFNLLNLLCCFSVGYSLDFAPSEMLDIIQSLKPVTGRMEPVYNKNQKLVVIDYSHTPDALEKALMSLRELRPRRLILVFGCGGGRDSDKRSQMGRVASRHCDKSIITNDNPRAEDPLSIAKQVEEGWETDADYEILLDRKKAIQKAASKMNAGDILMIAGKGHENYQILNDTKKYFSDHAMVKEVVQ